MNRAWTAITVTAAALIPALSSAQPSSFNDHPLFKSIQEKSARLSFAGVRVVTFKGRGGENSFYQRVLRKGSLERIEYPAGSPYAGQILVENSTGRYHYVPAEKIIRKTPRGSGGGPLGMNFGMGPHGPFGGKVDIRTFDGGEVAGLATTFVRLRRHDDGTTFLKLWVDESHGCVLKREMFDSRGNMYGSYTFTSIKYTNTLRDRLFELNIPGVPVMTVDQEMRKLAKDLNMNPYRLKDETKFKLTWVKKFDSEELTALMQVYSNNRIRLSLFQVRGAVNSKKMKELAGDRVNVYVWKKEKVSFALMGDMEQKDLKGLASSLTL